MSVYKRGKKKVFYMNFVLNGKRVFKSTGKYTKREARLVEAEERRKLLKDSQLSPQEKGAKTLLLDAVEEVFEAKWQHGKDSIRSYRRACNLAKLVGNVPLGSITEEAVSKLTRRLDRRGSSTGTVNRYLASLKTILKHKKQDTSFIRLRKERQGRIRTISKEEEQQIIHLLRDTDHNPRRYYFPDVGDLVIVLSDTGMRLSEALNLQYEDIDFTTGLITIWINKGDKARSIPMTRRVRAVLESRKSDNQRVFNLQPSQAQTAWQWVRKSLGLTAEKEFVLHALRHTTASRMVNAGVDLYVVKEILGHSSIQVTERYAHLAPHKLSNAISALEDL